MTGEDLLSPSASVKAHTKMEECSHGSVCTTFITLGFNPGKHASLAFRHVIFPSLGFNFTLWECNTLTVSLSERANFWGLPYMFPNSPLVPWPSATRLRGPGDRSSGIKAVDSFLSPLVSPPRYTKMHAFLEDSAQCVGNSNIHISAELGEIA